MSSGIPDRLQAKREEEARRARFLAPVERYARGRLVRRLGAPGPPKSLRPATRGVRSLVFLLDFEGFPRVVLRANERWLRAARLVYNFRSFARMRLPVPELLVAELSPLARRRWGFYATVERFHQGRHPDEAPDRQAAVRAVARALARMHNIQRRRWGWPGFPRWGSYRRYFLGRVAERAGHLAKALPAGRRDRVLEWFRHGAADAPLDPPFSLTHSRVNNGNFVVRPDGEATVVDLIEARYGTFCPDLISALHRICDDDESLMAAFLEEYFEGRPRECRDVFEASRAFFEAYRVLGCAGTYARRIPRSQSEAEAQAYRERLAHQVARLAHLTGLDLALK